jgi:hypothetical protein
MGGFLQISDSWGEFKNLPDGDAVDFAHLGDILINWEKRGNI